MRKKPILQSFILDFFNKKKNITELEKFSISPEEKACSG